MVKLARVASILLIVLTVAAADTYYHGGTILTMVGKVPQYVECILTRE